MSAPTLNQAPPTIPGDDKPLVTSKAPKKAKFDAGILTAIVVGLAAVALTLGPILYLIIGGFRTQQNLASNPAGLPDPCTPRPACGAA